MTDDYPVPQYVVIDGHGVSHAAFFAGQEHDRYIRTYCEWWKTPELRSDPRNRTVQLHPRDRHPPTCMACAGKNSGL